MTEWILFIVLTAVAVGSALMMVLNRNPVHAALWLVLTFLAVAVFFLVLGAQFLFAAQIIIYTGAIMVLFLFVVMLLNLEREREPIVTGGQRAAAVALAFALLAVLVIAIAARTSFPTMAMVPGGITLTDLGVALFDEWLLPFELASILLLVAMIGAIALARRRT
ncbi:MAG: NADH-quinone oxidoreductase subunit J [Armatimonadetes bacterium]|nr:NADH-quinone oxidoreductase subunit J [Armatimonadota bacterium]